MLSFPFILVVITSDFGRPTAVSAFGLDVVSGLVLLVVITSIFDLFRVIGSFLGFPAVKCSAVFARVLAVCPLWSLFTRLFKLER